MVAFTAFIVEADKPVAIPAKVEAVFVRMGAPGNWRRQTPNYHFDNRTIRQDAFFPVDEFSLHVGIYAINE